MIDQCRGAIAYYNKMLSIDETLTNEEGAFTDMTASEKSSPEDPLFYEELMTLDQAARRNIISCINESVDQFTFKCWLLIDHYRDGENHQPIV